MFELGNAEKNYLLDAHADNKYYTKGYDIDVNDKNNVKIIIKDYIKEKSECLDVGCGAGYLGKILKKYKDAKVYGIDVDIEALKVAKETGCFEELYNFSITERKGAEYQKFVGAKKKFDYIIFADVLEHITNADDVMKFFSRFLKPEGELLISLPNVAHFDIVKGLVERKFNYSHTGLLDNTHLRFYTRTSFEEFVEQLNKIYKENFALKEIGKTIIEPGYLYQYPKLYELLNQDGEACVLQYVYAIRRGKARPKKNDSNKKNSAFRRLENELEDLERKRNDIESMTEDTDRLRARVAELEAVIDNIYNSKSWAMMRPMRGVSRAIKTTVKIANDKLDSQRVTRAKNNLKKVGEMLTTRGIATAVVTSQEDVTKEWIKELVRSGCQNVLMGISVGDLAPVFKENNFRIVALVDRMHENLKDNGRNLNFYANWLIFDNAKTKEEFQKKFDKVGAKTKIMSWRAAKENVAKLAECFKDTPKQFADLSVVIPNYNYEKYLPMRIESIARQTIKPKEIILLDDDSTDNSLAVAEPMLKRVQEEYGIEYRIIKNEQNAGCFKQWGKGFREAKYDFVWMAEADDYARPNFVEVVMPSFKNDEVTISYCKSCKIDSNSVVADYDFNWYIEDLDKKKWTRDFVDGGDQFIEKFLRDRNSIPNASAAIIRKSATKDIANELDKYQAIGDWLAYIYIISQGKVYYHADVLNGFRRHEKSIIATEEQSPLFLKEKEMIAAYLSEKFGV